MTREPREAFEKMIISHMEDIKALSAIVENSILQSVETLINQDLETAKYVYDLDQAINEKRYEIEEKTLVTVATQQPMAGDLRKLSSVIDLAGELERIGDYAKGIARITMRIGEQPLLKSLDKIPEMAEITAGMLKRSVQAFIDLDEPTALRIVNEDDEIDARYNALYRELLDLMIADRNNIDQATFLLWVAHNLERAADRVTNICERVVFTTSGKLVEFDRSDDELEAF
jgi:phosphate transport system protein